MVTPLCFALALVTASIGVQGEDDVYDRIRRPADVQSVDIRATLDRDGRLHVVERQRLRITPQNDGARRQIARSFLRGVDVSLVSRVEGDSLVPLTRGDLTSPGQYAIHGGMATILWTFDSDPPEQMFQLEYSLLGTVIARPGGYRVEYDALPATTYGEARAELTLDRAWDVVPSTTAGDQPLDLAIPVEKRPLLLYVGAGEPAYVPELAPESLRRNLTTGIGAACFVLFLLFVRHEWSVGRLRDPRPPRQLNASVVRDDLLSLFPQLEQPGGTDDDSAILARMIESGKVLIHFDSGLSDQLHLFLARSRDELTSEERTVAALLFGAGPITSTSQLRKPRRSVMAPRDATHWSTRGLVVLIWVIFTAGSCYSTRLLTSAEILYQLFTFALTPLFLIVVSIAGNARWYAAGPTRLLARAVGFGALPAIVITLLINQDRVLLPPALYVSAAILAVSTFADALQAARSSPDEAARMERRQRAIGVADAIERRWNMSRKVDEQGYAAGRSGFTAKSSAAGCVAALIAVGVMLASFVVGGRGNETLAYGLLYGGGLVFIVAILLAASRKPPAGVLQTAAAPPPPVAALPVVAPPRWEGRVDQNGAAVIAKYGPFTWTLTSEVPHVVDAGSILERRVESSSLWRSNEGAVAGTLVFRPRNVSPQWLDTFLFFRSAKVGISQSEVASATPLPVDDEHLLLHYTVLSSDNLNANHISPALRAALTHLGESMRSPTAPAAIRGLLMVAFNSRGTVLLSEGAADSEAAVRTFATAGLRVAAALRPPG